MNLQTMLVGVNFRPKSVKLTVEYLKTGDTLRLERDAENAYDINAVKVMKDTDGQDPEWLGFIARNDAATIAPIMDGGSTVLCKVLHQNGIKEVHLHVEYDDDAVAVQTAELPSFKSPEASEAVDDEIPF